ncbi:MAG: hypothetical protein QM497_01875 [Sulfurimonas sp.]
MSKKEQKSFSSVISVNPYRDKYFTGISSFLSETKTPEFSKEQLAISYLNTRDFITTQIAISKNILDEDLSDAINSKAYDDLGLDQAIEYNIQYIESFSNLDEDNRYFHVFIVDPLTIDETFASTVEKLKYIDTIIPTPLLIKSLYAKDNIQLSGVHCFIYFQANDAFVTIYSEKEFVYTKSIKYSFIEMHERFCELYGERIEYDDFINFFSKINLRDTDSNYKQFFIKLYKELFANINDILTYAKRAFDIDKFEQVYIGSQIATVTQLSEMLEVEINVKTDEFNFDYGFDNNGVFIDQLHYLMHVYTTLPAEDKYLSNFTAYHRPPSFIQRESGKLIILVAASLLIAFAYPVTYWVLTYAQELQYDILQKKHDDLKIIKTTREATIKNREADKAKSLVLLSKEKKEYLEKKNTLTKIHEIKVDYPMKAKLLALLTKDLNKFGINLDSISYAEEKDHKKFTLSLIATKDKKITQLVEYLTKIHEKEFKFSLEKISYKEESKRYLSELKVEIL